MRIPTLNVYVLVCTSGVVRESDTRGRPSRSPPCTASVAAAGGRGP